MMSTTIYHSDGFNRQVDQHPGGSSSQQVQCVVVATSSPARNNVKLKTTRVPLAKYGSKRVYPTLE